MGGLDQAFTGQAGDRRTSVLAARVAHNANSSATSRDEARIRCLRALMQAAEVSGGRVLRQQRDTVLVLLGSPDAAVAAAARMLAYAGSGDQGVQYDVRIGVASGKVTQRDCEVVGDTVELALQFSRKARNGQILASESTAANLTPAVQKTLRLSPSADQNPLFREITVRDRATELLALHKENPGSRSHTVLRLDYRGQTLLRRREIEYVNFGRDPGSHIVVNSQSASRRHCTVSRHDDAFVLQDHSKNGTYLMIRGEGEIFVHSDAVRLGKEGWICLGKSADENDDIIQYKVLLSA